VWEKQVAQLVNSNNKGTVYNRYQTGVRVHMHKVRSPLRFVQGGEGFCFLFWIAVCECWRDIYKMIRNFKNNLSSSFFFSLYRRHNPIRQQIRWEARDIALFDLWNMQLIRQGNVVITGHHALGHRTAVSSITVHRRSALLLQQFLIAAWRGWRKNLFQIPKGAIDNFFVIRFNSFRFDNLIHVYSSIECVL